MITTRAQWPHTVEDITKSLDGIWGLVGATGVNGNLYRLERSLHQPLVYTLTEYDQGDEAKVVKKETFSESERQKAIEAFARAIGF